MPWPSAHAVLTEKLYTSLFSNYEKGKFFVGALFPDIRYLGVIEKSQTHKAGVTRQDVFKETNPFYAGALFHAHLDLVEQKYWDNTGIYQWGPKTQFINPVIRYIQDRVLYDKIANWEELKTYFNKIFPEQLAYNILEKDIVRWHDGLKMIFSNITDLEKLKAGMEFFSFPQPVIDEIVLQCTKEEGNKKIADLAEQLYEQIDSLI